MKPGKPNNRVLQSPYSAVANNIKYLAVINISINIINISQLFRKRDDNIVDNVSVKDGS